MLHLPGSPNFAGSVLRRNATGLRAVGGGHIIEHGLALLIDEAGEELLGVPEDQRPGKDLRGGVKCAEARDELTTHEQQTKEGGNRPSREFERGKSNR